MSGNRECSGIVPQSSLKNNTGGFFFLFSATASKSNTIKYKHSFPFVLEVMFWFQTLVAQNKGIF